MLDLLRRNASGPFGLTLIILLVLAFSVWGIGDIFRNYDVGTLARIGDREVDSQEFLFRYNREINRISNELERFVSNEEARDSGIDIQILTNLLVEKTLNSSADEMKLRPSDNSLTERLKNTSSFRNAFNQFDKNVFNQVLRQNGITEDLFFSMERDSIAQAQIYRALFENLNISKEFSNLIHRFQNEDRSVDYLVLNTNTKNVDPYEINDQELLSYYNNNKDNYKSESKRDFTLLTAKQLDLFAPNGNVGSLNLGQYNTVVTDWGMPVSSVFESETFQRGSLESKLFTLESFKNKLIIDGDATLVTYPLTFDGVSGRDINPAGHKDLTRGVIRMGAGLSASPSDAFSNNSTEAADTDILPYSHNSSCLLLNPSLSASSHDVVITFDVAMYTLTTENSAYAQIAS